MLSFIVGLIGADALMFHCEKPLGSVVVLLSISWLFHRGQCASVSMESAYSLCTPPTRQTEKKAEDFTTGLYLSGKNFAPPEQEVWLSREHSFGKDETENPADEIYMNTAAI